MEAKMFSFWFVVVFLLFVWDVTEKDTFTLYFANDITVIGAMATPLKATLHCNYFPPLVGTFRRTYF